MRKSVVCVVLSCLLSIGPISCLATADDEPVFQVSWLMYFPRYTYFIGETVSFRVQAYAQNIPELPLSDQYANIVVRNESLFEVFNYWIYTDANGSAWVNWTTQLDYANGTYMVILTDGFGASAIASVTLLWDQNTAWQRQLDDIQLENDYLWGYMDELYAARNYLYKRNTILTHAIYVLSAIALITVGMSTWVFVREYIRVNARLGGKRSGISSILGIRTVPFFVQTLDHAEAANYQIPEHHKAPRFGEDFTCPLCDKEGKVKMTKHQWEEHLQGFHDRKLIGFTAWVKNRRFREMLEELYDKDEAKAIHDALRPENVLRTKLQSKVEELKELSAKGEISKLEARLSMDAYRVELGLKPRYNDKVPVHKETPSQNIESTRKPQGQTRPLRALRRPMPVPRPAPVPTPAPTPEPRQARMRKVKVL